jgi:hypothetical protein
LALTALKVKDLADKGFMKLFDDHEALWKTKAREAYGYAEKFVTAEPVRPDDVLPLLVPSLELSEEFRSFLEEKRLTQQYWRLHFGELVLDKLWTELTEQKGEGENDGSSN